MTMELRELIEAYLSRRGIKKGELSDRLGMSLPGLNKMLDRGTIMSDVLIRIQEVLDIPPAEIMGAAFGPDWSITQGDGSAVSGSGPVKVKNISSGDIDLIKTIIESKDQVIEAQKEVIEGLKHQLNECKRSA